MTASKAHGNRLIEYRKTNWLVDHYKRTHIVSTKSEPWKVRTRTPTKPCEKHHHTIYILTQIIEHVTIITNLPDLTAEKCRTTMKNKINVSDNYYCFYYYCQYFVVLVGVVAWICTWWVVTRLNEKWYVHCLLSLLKKSKRNFFFFFITTHTHTRRSTLFTQLAWFLLSIWYWLTVMFKAISLSCRFRTPCHRTRWPALPERTRTESKYQYNNLEH